MREPVKQRARLPMGKVIKLSPDEGFGFIESKGRELIFATA
jgi:hypothetical protein